MGPLSRVVRHVDDLAPPSLETHRELLHVNEGFTDRIVRRTGRRDEEKASSAGPEELSPPSPRAERSLVGLVDAGVRDSGGERPLDPPQLVQETPEGGDVFVL